QRLNCPRCNSPNTKFCYFNNYNFSQPRHFCKSCRRYWTKGGALRNIPVGGGTRKRPPKRSGKRLVEIEVNGRRSPTEIAAAATTSPVDVAVMGDNFTGDSNDINGCCFSFTSLLTSDRLLDGLGPSSGLATINYGHISDSDPNPGHVVDVNSLLLDGLFTAEFHDSAAAPWPDLAVYAPGST
ncbi:hypothetical protein M569_12418, partial [Genlisea aurea]